MIIGYAYVVGDIIHEGHLLHLKNCKALCDKLIVGVLTDEACMEKKPAPAVPFSKRIQVVSGLACVDAAVTQATYSPVGNVLNIRPNILFENPEHDLDDIRIDLAHPPTGEEFEGRIITMPYYPETSSTKIKEAIRDVHGRGETHATRQHHKAHDRRGD